jgi:hypothetical protein
MAEPFEKAGKWYSAFRHLAHVRVLNGIRIPPTALAYFRGLSAAKPSRARK